MDICYERSVSLKTPFSVLEFTVDLRTGADGVVEGSALTKIEARQAALAKL